MNDQNCDEIKPIYVEKLFYEKNPGLARLIPKFLFSFLKRVICQEQINEFIARYGHRKGLDFADAILEFLEVRYEVKNESLLQQLPKEGRYIFVANHPLGGPDGIILISFLGSYFKKLKFPVNDLLLKLKNLNDIFLPVNKHGCQAKSAVIEMEEAYASDNQIIMFPAGMVSRKTDGIIKDLEWQKSFVTKAIKHQRTIVPIYIEARNSDFFYNLATFRKRIGLNLNLEMLYLPKETFDKKGEKFTLKIGEPIPWMMLDNGEKAAVWAERIKEILYALQ